MKQKIQLTSEFPLIFGLKNTLEVSGLNPKNKSGHSYVRVPDELATRKLFNSFKDQLQKKEGFVSLLGLNAENNWQVLTLIKSSVDIREKFLVCKNEEGKTMSRYDWLYSKLVDQTYKSFKLVRCTFS